MKNVLNAGKSLSTSWNGNLTDLQGNFIGWRLKNSRYWRKYRVLVGSSKREPFIGSLILFQPSFFL